MAKFKIKDKKFKLLKQIFCFYQNILHKRVKEEGEAVPNF